MRALWRLFAVPVGLLLAVTASGACLVVAALADPAMAAFAGDALEVAFRALLDAAAADDPGPLVATLGSAGRLLAIVLLAPPVFVALVSEVLGARGLVWQAGATGLLSGALPWLARGGARPATPEELRISAILALSGAAAGFVYWLVAGHGAGADPSPAQARRPP